MRWSLKILAMTVSGITLLACETTPKTKGGSCPKYNAPLEGRIKNYFPCMMVGRRSPYTSFTVSTQFSGTDKTDDVDNRIVWPYVSANSGTTVSSLNARINFELNPYDHKNKLFEQPPSAPLIASISGWADGLDVTYLRRRSDVEMTEEWSTDEYFITLSSSFIDHLKAANPSDDLSYIGDYFTVNIDRPDYGDLSFKVNPSEILAAVYAAQTDPSCPADKAPKISDAYSLKYYSEGCEYKTPMALK